MRISATVTEPRLAACDLLVVPVTEAATKNDIKPVLKLSGAVAALEQFLGLGAGDGGHEPALLGQRGPAGQRSAHAGLLADRAGPADPADGPRPRGCVLRDDGRR